MACIARATFARALLWSPDPVMTQPIWHVMCCQVMTKTFKDAKDASPSRLAALAAPPPAPATPVAPN